MSTLFNNPETNYDTQHQNDTVLGAAYDNTAEDGYSIMPPEQDFSTQPLEGGGKIEDKADTAPDVTTNEEKGEWTTPREHEQVSSRRAATIKLHQIKVHINYLLDLAENSGKVKKPESLEELVKLTKDCDDIMKFLNEDSDNEPHLTPGEADLLNDVTTSVDITYADVFGVIIGQAQKATRTIGNIPDMKGVDASLKELMRQHFGDKNQEELDKIMYTIEGTKEYHRIVDALKNAAWNAGGEIGGMIWAEGLKRVDDALGKALENFKSKGEYLISFVSGLLDVFGTDPSEPVDGMRKTFDLVGTIIDNPLTATLLKPLWKVYKPAIDFCLDGIDMIKKQRDEQFNLIGISRGLQRYVKENEPGRITRGMTLGLPGISEGGKRDLLVFMMEMHSKGYIEAVKVEVPSSVKSFFENNKDLINAGDKERLKTDYNNPLNPWDNELKDIASSAHIYRDTIWAMLYGTMLTPPKRKW